MQLQVNQLHYSITDGQSVRPLIDMDAFHVDSGEQWLIKGPSGAGKSTLIRLLSGQIVPQTGKIYWDNDCLTSMSTKARDQWRGANCGFVFQDFGLFEGLTALENVLLPQTFTGSVSAEAKHRAKSLLHDFQVEPETRAECLSRGEMQRVALVRACFGAPKILFADEPTASLDEANGQRVIQALKETAVRLQATLFVVSHEPKVWREFSNHLTVSDGRVTVEQSGAGAL